MFENFGQQLYDNIILLDRYLIYLDGLKNTLLLTFGAAIIGTIIGTLVAICKIYAKQKKVLKPLDILCDIYLTVIRGTPAMVQVLIFGYIIFKPNMSGNGMLPVAIFALGINSGAYVAEIVRSGIQAVDIGQSEAGRSLGLTNNKTMQLIILPQAVKNILPAIANEAIVLLKETAIVSIIAVADLTYSGILVRSRTFSPVPLLLIAAIYLIVVLIMTMGLRALERRLSRSDKRN
ncbi:amino acid ABC transporter permease [Eubacteriales bacterium OttesenSCG-928-K08]|nr:amino acid ABC transporter permease [Eubacteriales bacterium OttesenSCG-928-K08]